MADLYPSRRDLFRMSGGALALGSLSRSTQASASQPLLRGRVHASDTGVGLPGVRVSNGRDIALTDEGGRYALPPNGEASIFVIKPAGWSAPRDPKTMLSRIHHQPDAGRSLDFALERVAEDASFDVLMFADPQPSNNVELDYLRAQIANGFSGLRAAFGLTLGDLVGDDHGLFERYNEVIAQIGAPWWNLPGNHDLDFSAADGAAARAPWRRVFGPTTYAFEYGQATFVMLDNVDWLGHQDGSHRYAGRIGADNLTFVEALLSDTPQDRIIVLCMHIPLTSMADPLDPGSNTADRDALLALVGERPCVSFSGHMHTTEHHYIPLSSGALHHHHILTALSGSWWSGPLDPLGMPMAQSCDGSPNGWHVLSIDGANYTTRFVSAREPSQMRIMLASDSEAMKARSLPTSAIAHDKLMDTQILVNVFDGGPRTRVEACVSGCSPSIMARSFRPDPLTEDLFRKAGPSKKPWVQAEPSSHIWQTALPADLAPGLHRLNVTVKNEYGALHHSALIFEIIHS